LAKSRSIVAVAALIWGGSILLSRVIGLVREAVIGRILGGGSEADVFWTAFVLPDFLNYLLAGGALSLVFIPIFNHHLNTGNEDRGWEAFSVIANFLVALMVLVLPLLWIKLPVFVPIIAPGFDEIQSAQLVHLTRIILPAQAFHIIGGLLSASLQARDRHLLPALAPLLYTSSVIVGGLVGGVQAGADGFAWGVLIGSILGPFGLPFLGCLRHGLRWQLKLHFRHIDLRTYIWRSVPIMLGFSIVFLDDWILRRQGSLLDAGSISTLQYAKTLMKVPMGVFGLAAGVAAFPTLTRLISVGDRSSAYKMLSGVVRRMLVLALAAQVALTSAGPEIARVIYGARLPEAQHYAIGAALGWMGIGLWAWAAQTVIARGFYALGKTWMPTVIGSMVVIACYPLYSHMRVELGVNGLAMTSALAISVYVILLIFALRRQFPGETDDYRRFFVTMIPLTALSLGAGHIARSIQTDLPAIVQGTGYAMVAMGVFFGLAILLRVPEVFEVATLVSEKVSRKLKNTHRSR